jgi:hypothetical protein
MKDKVIQLVRVNRNIKLFGRLIDHPPFLSVLYNHVTAPSQTNFNDGSGV